MPPRTRSAASRSANTATSTASDPAASATKHPRPGAQHRLSPPGAASASDDGQDDSNNGDDDDDDDDDRASPFEEADSDSADEWRPDPDVSQARKRRQGRRGPPSRNGSIRDDDDDEDDGGDNASDVDDELVQQIRAANQADGSAQKGTKRKKNAADAPSKRAKASIDRAPSKRKATEGQSVTANKGGGGGDDDDGDDDDDDEEEDDVDSEAEREQARIEAEAAWANVRSRKAAAAAATKDSDSASAPADGANGTPATATAGPRSLTSWLGVGPSASSSADELSSLPWPTTCEAAQIVDRSSLFIGYVYPLLTTSASHIAALLSHLSRLVHPTVPVTLLPPQFANAPANKRGSSHDMYAYRVLSPKRGRAGLTGPDDFALHEEKEDDGEKWGGDRVLRVARDEGASDVLVIVSRWYGGELLGPVRFEHIENAARRALERHIEAQTLEHRRMELDGLDQKVESLRAKIAQAERGHGFASASADGGVASAVSAEAKAEQYPDLNVAKADRLLLARRRTIQVLDKKLHGLENPLHTAPSTGEAGAGEGEHGGAAGGGRGGEQGSEGRHGEEGNDGHEDNSVDVPATADGLLPEMDADEEAMLLAEAEAMTRGDATTAPSAATRPDAGPPSQPVEVSSDTAPPPAADGATPPAQSTDTGATIKPDPDQPIDVDMARRVKVEPADDAASLIKPDPDAKDDDEAGPELVLESDASLSDPERQLSSSPELEPADIKASASTDDDDDDVEAYGEERCEGDAADDGEDLAGWAEL
ncbi:uncharacterized protein PFL1_01450 [Pseudozyma flocculosa PF-1]|uniref:Impact N-terminal domain-containing protein n=1 Tax=Pseudozyma flocculosa TaxID=84751 RepID=A0A5C3EXA7_9BASI|nr:uncharacterized protein PFL1_01450 [Pseudozyma flocculosa PF-1]EPQ31265.1 hypothetical protein PFL1_01450 [Pseudozyma flocculosa PF-1]SPO36236.1 uncharacterized protein PSFLO_01707 [Pseudozyma flocculosa]